MTSERMNESSNIKFLTDTISHLSYKIPLKALEAWTYFGVMHDIVNLLKNNFFRRACEECTDLMSCTSRKIVKLDLSKHSLLKEFISHLIPEEQINLTTIVKDVQDKLLDLLECCMISCYN